MAIPIQPLQRPYLFLDTETGGLDPGKHSLLSIGLVVGDEGVVRHSLEILVKHETYVVSGGGLKVNRIDLVKHDAVALEPTEAVAVLDVFLQQYFPCVKEPITLVGHNVAFDRDFLGVFLAEQNRSLEPRFSHRLVDTHSIAAALRDAGRLGVENLSSSALFAYYGIEIPEEKRHTALGDALGTFRLYWKLVESMK
jgi:DNA polymerase III epsilon subunit-like protein